MKIIGLIFQQYLIIPFENFTAKLISARALLKLLSKDFSDDEDYKSKIERINFIEESTHKDILVSLYKLDRNINPSKGEFKTVYNKTKFLRNEPDDEGNEYMTLDEDQMQYYLCKSIAEIHDIVIETMRVYKEEEPLEMGEFDDTSNKNPFGDI